MQSSLSVIGLLYFLQVVLSNEEEKKENMHILNSTIPISKPMEFYSENKLNIFCHNMLNNWLPHHIWRTVNVHVTSDLEIDDLAMIFVAENASQLHDQLQQYNKYTFTSFWNSFTPVSVTDVMLKYLSIKKKMEHIINLPLYEDRCIGFISKTNLLTSISSQSHKLRIQLKVYPVDVRLMFSFIAGCLLFIFAKPLSKNIVFYYLTGILCGLIFSIFISVYLATKIFPFKGTGHYLSLVTGYTFAGVMLNYILVNFGSLFTTYKVYVGWYFLAVTFICTAYLYYRGPVRNQRCLNLIHWSLNIIGIIIAIQLGTRLPYNMFFYTALIAGVPVACFKLYRKAILPVLRKISSLLVKWHLLNPRPRKLLSSDEYVSQAHDNTLMELDHLRDYCHSPECNQWDIMKRLNNKDMFISFMEGNDHVSFSERNSYSDDMEDYSFGDSIRKNKIDFDYLTDDE